MASVYQVHVRARCRRAWGSPSAFHARQAQWLPLAVQAQRAFHVRLGLHVHSFRARNAPPCWNGPCFRTAAVHSQQLLARAQRASRYVPVLHRCRQQGLPSLRQSVDCSQQNYVHSPSRACVHREHAPHKGAVRAGTVPCRFLALLAQGRLQSTIRTVGVHNLFPAMPYLRGAPSK